MPASRPSLIAKALEAGSDGVIIDLEDAVAPAEKATARDGLAASCPVKLRGLPAAVSVRVNAPRTPWCHLDVLACVDLGVATVMLPKVESPADIEFIDRLLAGAEAAAGLREPIVVQALIETASGVANAREIARAAPRLGALVLGYADLAASLGRTAASSESWHYAQDSVLVAARSAGLAAIDGPHLGVAVDDEFLASVDWAVGLGFDGKWVIHPRHVPAVQDAFKPGVEEVDKARRILAALAESHRQGIGAATLDGAMIDEAVAVWARRVQSRTHEGEA